MKKYRNNRNRNKPQHWEHRKLREKSSVDWVVKLLYPFCRKTRETQHLRCQQRLISDSAAFTDRGRSPISSLSRYCQRSQRISPTLGGAQQSNNGEKKKRWWYFEPGQRKLFQFLKGSVCKVPISQWKGRVTDCDVHMTAKWMSGQICHKHLPGHRNPFGKYRSIFIPHLRWITEAIKMYWI